MVRVPPARVGYWPTWFGYCQHGSGTGRHGSGTADMVRVLADMVRVLPTWFGYWPTCIGYWPTCIGYRASGARFGFPLSATIHMWQRLKQLCFLPGGQQMWTSTGRMKGWGHVEVPTKFCGTANPQHIGCERKGSGLLRCSSIAMNRCLTKCQDAHMHMQHDACLAPCGRGVKHRLRGRDGCICGHICISTSRLSTGRDTSF